MDLDQSALFDDRRWGHGMVLLVQFAEREGHTRIPQRHIENAPPEEGTGHASRLSPSSMYAMIELWRTRSGTS